MHFLIIQRISFLLVPTSCFIEGLVLTGFHIPLITIACISFLKDVLKPLGSLLATDRSKAVVLV